MTARSLSTVWGMVLIIVFSVTITLERVGTREVEFQIEISGAPVVLIGSSLVRDAIPWAQIEDGVLADGRPHIRLTEGKISERQSLRYLKDAISGGAGTIFLEIGPFSFDFNTAFEKKAHEKEKIILPTRFDFVKDFSKKVELGMHRMSNLVEVDYSTEDHEDLSVLYDGVPAEHFRMMFPLHLRQPNYGELLTKQVERARAGGIELFFVSPPRSASTLTVTTAEEYDALIRMQRKISAQYGVPLFELGPLWPDDLFRDMTHLNVNGRERFLDKLADWYSSRK